MLEALAAGDGARLLEVVSALAEFSPDWNGVLDALAEALHRIQVCQLVPGASGEADGIDAGDFAQRLRPEVVQLWYQMAVNGRRDLHLAPSPRVGFEMSVLRMLAFRPAGAGQVSVDSTGGGEVPRATPRAVTAPAGPAPASREAAPAPVVARAALPGPVPVQSTAANGGPSLMPDLTSSGASVAASCIASAEECCSSPAAVA